MTCDTCSSTNATFVVSKTDEPLHAICYLCMIFKIANRQLAKNYHEAVAAAATKTRGRGRPRKLKGA